MNVRASSAEYFASAAKKLIQGLGRGGQEKVAQAIGVSPSHLSDIINERKNWTDDLRDRLAHYFQLDVAEIMFMGRGLVETGVWFPHGREVSDLPPRSMERAERIYVLAARESGFRDFRFFAPECLRVWAPALIEQYVGGKISDGQLYESAVILCRKTIGKNNI